MKGHILLTNIKVPETVRSCITNRLVDIAGASEVSKDWARVEVEDDIDLSNESDRNWLVGLIRRELEHCGESEAKIQIS